VSKRPKLPDPRHLADLCARGEFRTPLWNHPAVLHAHARDFAAGVDRSVVIEASNVAEYFYAGTDQEDWSLADFPCLAPPYETMFIEMRRPTRIVSELTGVTRSDRLPWRWGVLVRASADDPTGHLRGEEFHWTLCADMVEQDGPDDPIDGPTVRWIVAVDDQGTGVKALTLSPASPAWTRQHPDVNEAFEAMSPFLWPTLLTLSFMHCRNVRTVDNSPPPRVQDFRRKTGRRPLFEWVTLDIDPMKEVLRREGNAADVGLQRALHRCRGHFKDYRAGHGLFGKLHGVYFFGDVQRGDAALGVREKDYRIAPVERQEPADIAEPELLDGR
jgi:hypothetical protein